MHSHDCHVINTQDDIVAGLAALCLHAHRQCAQHVSQILHSWECRDPHAEWELFCLDHSIHPIHGLPLENQVANKCAEHWSFACKPAAPCPSNDDIDHEELEKLRDSNRICVANLADAWSKFAQGVESDHDMLLWELSMGGEDWWCEDFGIAETLGTIVFQLRPLCVNTFYVSCRDIMVLHPNICACAGDEKVDLLSFALRHAFTYT